MPVTVEWDNDEQTAVRLAVVGNWQWREAQQAILQSNAMLDTVDHPVDYLIDMRLSGPIPANAIQAIRWVFTQTAHPNDGAIAVVQASSLARSLLTSAAKIYAKWFKGRTMIFVPTLEEARSRLAELRAPTLTPQG